MSRAGQFIRVGLVAAGILVVAGVAGPLILRARLNSDRVSCQNHLKDIGLTGMRHASLPGKPLSEQAADELPSGTVPSNLLPPDKRLSWYVYTLNVLDTGPPPSGEPAKKHRSPRGLREALTQIDPAAAWDADANAEAAKYRLTTAICPARTAGLEVGTAQPNNYIALGGLGLDTPTLPRDLSGAKAGAFCFDSPTPLAAFADGLRHTAQFVETARDVGPWLRGGPSTLRGLDEADTPYLGVDRPFGGCHAGGAYVSFADGSVTFLRDSVNPAVFRAMLTIAGGPAEQPGDDS